MLIVIKKNNVCFFAKLLIMLMIVTVLQFQYIEIQAHAEVITITTGLTVLVFALVSSYGMYLSSTNYGSGESTLLSYNNNKLYTFCENKVANMTAEETLVFVALMAKTGSDYYKSIFDNDLSSFKDSVSASVENMLSDGTVTFNELVVKIPLIAELANEYVNSVDINKAPPKKIMNATFDFTSTKFKRYEHLGSNLEMRITSRINASSYYNTFRYVAEDGNIRNLNIEYGSYTKDGMPYIYKVNVTLSKIEGKNFITLANGYLFRHYEGEDIAINTDIESTLISEGIDLLDIITSGTGEIDCEVIPLGLEIDYLATGERNALNINAITNNFGAIVESQPDLKTTYLQVPLSEAMTYNVEPFDYTKFGDVFTGVLEGLGTGEGDLTDPNIVTNNISVSVDFPLDVPSTVSLDFTP